MTGRTGLILVAALGVGMLMLPGCSSKGVTQENYEKIETGMTLEQVQDILGEGKQGASIGGAIGDLAGSGSAYVWEEGDKKITVMFKDNKVVSKAQANL